MPVKPIVIQIAQQRTRRGWSQAELARRSGVPQATISRIEAAKTAGISFDTLVSLADALEMHPAALIERSER